MTKRTKKNVRICTLRKNGVSKRPDALFRQLFPVSPGNSDELGTKDSDSSGTMINLGGI